MVDLIDVVLEGIKDSVDWLAGQFMDGLRSGYQTLSEAMFGTPTPETNGPFVFGEPTNQPWIQLQDILVGGEVVIIALLILVMTVQGRHVIRVFNIGSTYEARKTAKTAWVGAFLIIVWYWIGTLSLSLVDGFTIALLPGLDTVTDLMADFLGGSVANPVLSLLFALVGGISMWTLQALLYIREILLYVYLYAMPIALAVAYGNVPVLSRIAQGFAIRFVPLAVLPLPAAVVFKGYDIVYSTGGLSPGTPFLQYLVAVSLPVVALYATWRTFNYATPLTAKALGGATRGAVLVGSVAAGGYLGNTSIATTAARWGPKAAAGQAVAERAAGRGENEGPSYRRTENDPSSTSEGGPGGDYEVDFTRGIH